MTCACLGTCFVSLALSATLAPLAARLASRLGAMDRPKALSIHSTPTPRTGGLAVLTGFLLAVGWGLLFVSGFSGQGKTTLLGIAIAGIIVAFIGLLDDMGRIPTRVEVSALLVPALLVVLLGQRVGFVPIAIIGIPLTLFYLVGGASAINLVDGMNGLAGGIGAIASAACFLLSWGQGDIGGAVLSLALLGALVGFLPHNFPGGRVFLGDNGSLFVGLMLAVLMVRISSRPYHLGGFLAPLLILGVPIGDTALAILRRTFQGGGVLSGDRRHTYDLLRERVRDVTTVLVMWGIAVSGGLMGLVVYRLGDSNGFVALALFVVWYALFFSLGAVLGAFRRASEKATLPQPPSTVLRTGPGGRGVSGEAR